MNPYPEALPAGGSRTSRIILIAGIHLMLLAPLLCLVLRIADPPGLNEKRALAEAPSWHPWHLTQWTSQAESWINDHFPQRSRVVRWNNLVHERILGGASADVIVGADGWLYYAGDGTADDILGRSPLSPGELEQWAHVLEGRKAWLAERGIKYLFVVAPNKSTIYPEHLPLILRVGARSGRLDQLLDYLKANTRVPVVDLRSALIAAKQKEITYWPWDSHWNGLGLLVADDEVVSAIRRLGVQTGPHDAGNWISVNTEAHLFDCTDLLGMRGSWPVQPVAVASMVRPPDLGDSDSPLSALPAWAGRPQVFRTLVSERASASGRVVMFSDSFFRAGGIRFDALGDLPLMLDFRRFVSIWDVSDFGKIAAVAEIEHPDVIVDQTTERLLGAVPAPNPEWEKARLGQAGP